MEYGAVKQKPREQRGFCNLSVKGQMLCGQRLAHDLQEALAIHGLGFEQLLSDLLDLIPVGGQDAPGFFVAAFQDLMHSLVDVFTRFLRPLERQQRGSDRAIGSMWRW